MPKIELITEIKSSIEICFDLSRSIDLHKISTSETNEKAIGGRTKGLINLNESVTWEATHFGFRQKLTSKIMAFERPNFFVDEQTKGIFKSMVHLHKFEKVGDTVKMIDVFEFESPFGFFGELFNRVILTNYLKLFLVKRNLTIKEFAESEKWKRLLNGKEYL